MTRERLKLCLIALVLALLVCMVRGLSAQEPNHLEAAKQAAQEVKSDRTKIWEGYYRAAANQLYHGYQYEHEPDRDRRIWHGLLQMSYGSLKEDWWNIRPCDCQHDSTGLSERIKELQEKADELYATERKHLKTYRPLLMKAIHESFKKDIEAGKWPLEPTGPTYLDEREKPVAVETIHMYGSPGYRTQPEASRLEADRTAVQMQLWDAPARSMFSFAILQRAWTVCDPSCSECGGEQ